MNVEPPDRGRAASSSPAPVAGSSTPAAAAVNVQGALVAAVEAAARNGSLNTRSGHRTVLSAVKRAIQAEASNLMQREDLPGRRFLTKADVTGGIETVDGRTLQSVGISANSKNIELAPLMGRGDLNAFRAQLTAAAKAAGVDPRCLRVAAEDPGVRTFLTVYDLWNGVVWYLGDGWGWAQEERILKPIDKLRSQLDTGLADGTLTKGGEAELDLRDRMHLRWKRLHRNRRKLHHTLARLYGALFRIVFRPNFSVFQLTRRHRSLSSSISRRMRVLSFYAFKLRLERVAAMTGLVIRVVNESFTSKICGSCGHYHRNLGRSKVFTCPECNVTEERGRWAPRGRSGSDCERCHRKAQMYIYNHLEWRACN